MAPDRRLPRIALDTAVDAVREHPGTALLLGSALLGTIAATLPTAGVYGGSGSLTAFRPFVPAGTDDGLGLRWVMPYTTPAAAREEAVAILGALLWYALLGTVLVGAATIASLAAARAAETLPDRRIRRAVGASRRQLLSAAVVEALLVGTLPVVLGGTLGWVGASAVLASWPGSLSDGSIVTLAAAVAVTLAVHAAGLVGPAFAGGACPGAAAERPGLPAAPVTFQVAASFVVLSTGALLAERASGLLSHSGAPAPHGRVITLELPETTTAARSGTLQTLLSTLESSGMRSASLTSPGTLSGLGHVATVLTECGDCREGGLWMSVRLKPATHRIVSADTFELMGIPVLAGRGITSRDDWRAPRVAVVSRSLAAREFQDGQPIGRRIHTGDDDPAGSTVVGVVPDVLPTALGGTLQPRYAVYTSVLQHPPERVDLLIRDAVPAASLDSILRQAGAGRMEARASRTERAMRRAELAPIRWFEWRFRLHGWAMAALVALGMIGYMALWVRSLEVEIGIRRSLGASRRRIFLWVAGRAALMGLKGVLVGLWLAVAFWQVLPTAVGGVPGWSTPAVVGYGVALTGVVAGAALVPAWRASRAPVTSLLQPGQRAVR